MAPGFTESVLTVGRVGCILRMRSRYPVGALVSLAINFNGEFVAEWWVSADVHAFIMDDKNQAGHGYGIADSSDVCSTPLWLSKQRHKRNLTMKPEVTGRLAAIAFNCHRKRP